MLRSSPNGDDSKSGCGVCDKIREAWRRNSARRPVGCLALSKSQCRRHKSRISARCAEEDCEAGVEAEAASAVTLVEDVNRRVRMKSFNGLTKMQLHPGSAP